MAEDDASFTMQLVDELSENMRAMKMALADIQAALGDSGKAAEMAGAAFKNTGKDVDKATEAMVRMDQAMAHQRWVKMKQGQAETAKLGAEFKKIDDAMAHQKWVSLKRAEVQSAKAAAAAKLHSDGLERVAALGPRLDDLAMGPIKAVGVAAGTAAVAVGAAAVAATVMIGGAIVEASSFAQKSRSALTQLTGSAVVAEREFDNVRHTAAELGLDVDDTQKSFQKLLAAQFSIGRSKDFIKMGGDLQAIGTTAEGVQSVMQGIVKIKNVGKLTGESLQQLQEGGLSGKLISDALQKSTGKDADAVSKMLSGGKIDAETGIEAIIEAVKHKVGEHELGEAGARFAESTMAGFTGKLKGGFRNAMIDIGIAVEPAITRITTLMSKSVDHFMKSGRLEQMSDTLIAAFDRFAGFIEQHWPTIEKVILGTIDFIIKGVWLVVDALEFMANNWDTISTILKGVGIVLGVVAAGAALMFAPFMLVVAAVTAVTAAIVFAIGWISGKLIPVIGALWETWKSTMGALVEPFVTAFQTIASIFDASGLSWGEKMVSIGKALVQGLINGILAVATLPVTLMENLASNMVGAYKTVMGQHSPSTVMEDAAIDTVAGVDVGVDKASMGAISEVTSVATDISSAFRDSLVSPSPANDIAPAASGMVAEAPALTGATADAAAAAVRSVPAAASEGGSGPDITVNVNVNGANASNPQELATDIATQVRRELEAIFDKAS